jgi:1-aminocyclopropane-1-carboxylate deaminase
MISEINENPVIQKLQIPGWPDNIDIYLKRDDLIHPEIAGNKWWKLKYNLEKARREGFDTILTFGGAYSNHIAATAAAGKIFGFKTIGIIRGEKDSLANPTLLAAKGNGMELSFVSREQYRRKADSDFLKSLELKYGKIYLIPEGGKNSLGVKGCMEIIKDINIKYDYICCGCGTGTTLAGIVLSKPKGVQALGFSSLKGGGFLQGDVQELIKEQDAELQEVDFKIITDYHFGGYGKVTAELIDYVKGFKADTGITLDLIYTGKMLFGIKDLLEKGFFSPYSSILIIHSGGIQGNQGFGF